MTTSTDRYPARLAVDYPERLDRVTTFFRLLWAIPILVILALLSAGSDTTVVWLQESGEWISETSQTGGGVMAGLAVATALMIVVRQRYPRWWFDFAREFTRFATRIGAYLALLTDRYPATEDEQAVHLELDYPTDVEHDLNRWLPLVKWILVIPHVVVLAVLAIGAVLAVLVAWVAILFTGRYPRALFDYVVGVFRWGLRVQAYATLLLTDRYPPFRLA
ncbi:DUF4389 domain-containing protein [Salsipaludibacter albus]|uniref:DUF4389 domain-containing protein n=1 Tax=Salsipaludibacter albus TaxID=2849650 RepID=UPI001EE4CA12|nr:DUF4389 domain-containing protein [Salsipaludibacter albus]MBY5162731.1 DUF4389 domain-containing protein [Salsipaludibacter albus]